MKIHGRISTREERLVLKKHGLQGRYFLLALTLLTTLLSCASDPKLLVQKEASLQETQPSLTSPNRGISSFDDENYTWGEKAGENFARLKYNSGTPVHVRL